MNQFTDPDTNDTAAAVEAGRLLGLKVGDARHVAPNGIPYALLPTADVGLKSLEPFLATPVVRRQRVETRTPRAFCDYFMAFQGSDTSRVFWWEPTLKVTGFLDYHSTGEVLPEGNGGGHHRVTFTATKTQDWTDWAGIDKQLLDQVTFAEFIEDHLETIAEPAGAVLLEMATKFEVGRTLAFRSAVRLNSGTTQLVYDEGETPGQVSIPTHLTLVLAPFEGVEPRPVKVRLRYKLGTGESAGKLTIGIAIVRPKDVLRQAFEDLVEAIRLDERFVQAAVPVIEGDVVGTFFATNP